jgi:fido (protein-threonine AMPylation protein)
VTDGNDLFPYPSFNVRRIGPDRSGATPIEDDDLEGLIPEWVATRADLNQVKFENIANYLPTALRQARSGGPEIVLQYRFLLDLHRRMFEGVWR